LSPLYSPATVAAVQQKSDSASKFVALEAKWNDAYKRSDIDAMNSLITDDFIITVEDGATYSKTGYIAHLAALPNTSKLLK
jgi:ketosteroid isomerase-like protein